MCREVGCRGQRAGGHGRVQSGDARGRAGTSMALAEGFFRVWVAPACQGSSSELSSSESTSGHGSGSSKKGGSPLGTYFSPMNVNAPESLMKWARAARPWGVPNNSGSASSRPCFKVGIRCLQESYSIVFQSTKHILQSTS
jgi:hypothetical protein